MTYIQTLRTKINIDFGHVEINPKLFYSRFVTH